MNIVKLQDDLQGMSVAFLRGKADGEDSNYPAWLVDAVLKQKLDARQKAELAAGAAGKGQPSVNEQLKQKAGLMALQGMQQKQAEGNMGTQMATTPQSIPPDVVQPEQQPQSQQAPMMAARGGLARLPMDPRMFDYGDGGIVAFSGGSDEKPVGSEDKPKKSFLDTLLEGLTRNKFPNPEARQKILELQAAQAAQEGPPTRNSKESIYGSAPSRTLPLAASVAAPQSPVVKTQPPVEELAGVASLPVPPRPADTAMVAQQKAGLAAPVAPKLRPAPQQLPAKPNAPVTDASLPTLSTDPVLKGQLSAALADPAYVPRTKEQILADEAFFTPEGLKSPAGMAELARLDAINKQYESNKGGRGMNAINAGLEAMMRGGNYGSGASNQRLAYETADLAQMEAQNKALAAIETTQRAEDTAKRTRGLGALDTEAAAGRKSKEDRRKDLTTAYGHFEQAAASKYTADAGISRQVLDNMNRIEVANINSRATAAAANRPGERERILATYLNLRAKDPKAAEQYMVALERIDLKGSTPKDSATPEQQQAAKLVPVLGKALAAAKEALLPFANRKPTDPGRVRAEIELKKAQKEFEDATFAAGMVSSKKPDGLKPDPAKDAPLEWNDIRKGTK